MKIIELFITNPYFEFNSEKIYFISNVLATIETDDSEGICKANTKKCPKNSHKHLNEPIRFSFEAFDVEGSERLYPEGHGPIKDLIYEFITDNENNSDIMKTIIRLFLDAMKKIKKNKKKKQK